MLESIDSIDVWAGGVRRTAKPTILITWIDDEATSDLIGLPGVVAAPGSILEVQRKGSRRLALEFHPRCAFVPRAGDRTWSWYVGAEVTVRGVLDRRTQAVSIRPEDLALIDIPQYTTLMQMVARFLELPS